MPIDKHTGEFIDLTEAKEMTNSYQAAFPNEPKCFFLGSEKLQSVIDQDGCIGLRMYRAFDVVRNEQNVVIVGVDANGNDMTSGLLLDRSEICPNSCDPTSPLS
ncbi:hypothetical protein [Flavobacterium beibuense]|uniref:hypothetical protein n=1 Tax=Flavobacterium beibuense TaxID=657326 RepID=UPI003A90D53A